MNETDRNYHYQKGLKDAWEAARKIVLEGGKNDLSPEELEEIFKTRSLPGIFASYSAAEAISKIKAYEEQKKIEDEIKVGDEIYSSFGDTVIVYEVNDVMIKAFGFGLCSYCHIPKKSVKKTGRHFNDEELLKILFEHKKGKENE